MAYSAEWSVVELWGAVCCNYAVWSGMLGGGTLGTGFLGIWVLFTKGPWGAGYLVFG